MPSPITNYIEQRKEEFRKKFGRFFVSPKKSDGNGVYMPVIDFEQGEYNYIASDEIESFHTETLTTVLRMVREMVEKVEIKGRNSFEGDDTKEKGKFLQEMYDNMIKPVLLSSLPDIT